VTHDSDALSLCYTTSEPFTLYPFSFDAVIFGPEVGEVRRAERVERKRGGLRGRSSGWRGLAAQRPHGFQLGLVARELRQQRPAKRSGE
jgi:hypothetical protein